MLASAAGALFVGASWLAARRLAGKLVSGTGLGPTISSREGFLSALENAAPIVREFRHAGSARDPVELAATFASPGDPATRPTILFLHGKGGHSSEWEPDARRALALGYNVLVPDLRGHGGSGGGYMTFGFLEKDDLGNAIAAAHELWGIDPQQLGVHSCSAGSSVALELAAVTPGIEAIWLESPFADPREMARHYLSAATGIPAPLLSLVTRWAVALTLVRVKRDLKLEEAPGGLEKADPSRRWRASAVRLRSSTATPTVSSRPDSSSGSSTRSPRAARSSGQRARGTVTTRTRRRSWPARSTSAGGPISSGSTYRSEAEPRLRGSSVRPFNCPHAAEASGPRLRRTVTGTPASFNAAAKRSIVPSSGRFQPGR